MSCQTDPFSAGSRAARKARPVMSSARVDRLTNTEGEGSGSETLFVDAYSKVQFQFQPYLNIEQAWLQLAPDINGDSHRKKGARPSTATECEECL
jgi:hypothetical protein